jgi:hypothetical protein
MNFSLTSNSSSLRKNLINPLHIGDASLQKLRSITTTPVIKTSTNAKPTVLILNNNSYIKSEPQETHVRLTNNGQNTISLATFVNNLNQVAILQSRNLVQQPTTSLSLNSKSPNLYFH